MTLHGGDDSELRRLRRRLWVERIVFVLALAAALVLRFGGLGGDDVCAIAVDGHPVAVVATRADADRLLDDIKETSGLPGEVSFSQKVTLHLVSAAGSEVLPAAKAMDILASKIEPVVEASAILVNGEIVVGLPSRDEAVRTLSVLLKEFSPPGGDASTAFKENVKIDTRQVGADSFAPSAAAAAERIVEAASPRSSHEVRPGETAWKIALDYHVPLSRLAAANPDANLDRIRAGDQLKIPGELPPLTVLARREIKESLPNGRTQTVRITYENGVEVSRDVIGRQAPLRGAAPRRPEGQQMGTP